MQPHLARAGRHVARLAPHWLLVLVATLAQAVPASALNEPHYLTEWGLVGLPTTPAFPHHATVDTHGRLYVTQVSPQRVSVFAGDGTLQFAWEIVNAPCRAYPYGVTVDGDGNAYVTDHLCSRVQKFDIDRQILTLWGGSGSTDGLFVRPGGIALDAAGNVLVADVFNHRIQKFGPAGNFLFKWGSEGSAPGQFNHPAAVAASAAGEVYVLDSFNQRVQVFDGSGAFLRAFGEQGFGPNALLQPAGMALDAFDNVYVADTENHRIMVYDSQGVVLASWGSAGHGPGQFARPHGVAVDALRNIYVVDSGNARIQKFGPLDLGVKVVLVVEPRTINVQGGGRWILAHIEPPAPYLPADIDVASLRLNGVAVDPDAPVDHADWDMNGMNDLTVRFSRSAIVATATPGAEELALSLTGTIAGVALRGADVVRLVNSITALEIERVAGVFGGAGTADLSLRGVTPNPATAGRGLTVRLTLAREAPASLEVLDLSGRRVLREDLAGLGAGEHQVGLGGSRQLLPGIYWIRVVQGDEQRQARFAVVR